MPSTTVTIDVHLGPEELEAAMREEAVRGLLSEPKVLQPKWFYDDEGSRLFDEITRLPEYYPTRCEQAILDARARDIVAAAGADTLVELGSGTSTKTRVLLAAMDRAGCLTRYVPFDVSEGTLRAASEAIALEHPGIEVHGVVGDFDHHLCEIPRRGRRMVAFLGGTIGNLQADARASFLTELAGTMQAGDSLLLGTDLVKDPARLVAAYDDRAGVTAEFNRNVLRVLNRALDADLDPEAFEHVALWNDDARRIEMRLRSVRDQRATIGITGDEISFFGGEEMRTETSAKFTQEHVADELTEAGFRLDHWWTDPDGDFALSLAQRW